MEGMTTGPQPAGGDPSRTRLAVGLAVATLLAVVILSLADADGAIWLVQGALAAATVVVALQAGGRSLRNIRAFWALIVGGTLLVIFFGFLIAEGL